MELSLSELNYDDLFGSADADVPALPTQTPTSEEQILLDEFPEISFDELEQYMNADNILHLTPYIIAIESDTTPMRPVH